MGASCSQTLAVDEVSVIAFQHWMSSSQDDQAVRLMLPVYFTPKPCTPSDLAMVRDCWDMITMNTSPEFLLNKEVHTMHTFPYATTQEWFSDTFYRRLFDVHPLSRPMFSKDSIAQGRFFVALFSFVFSVFNDPQRFKKRMQALAVGHNKKGIKAIEYGIIGEVMFYTLRIVLGDLYTAEAHKSWVRLFSNMLSVIVPMAVFCELRDSSSQLRRFADSINAHSFSFKADPSTHHLFTGSIVDVRHIPQEPIREFESEEGGGDGDEVKYLTTSCSTKVDGGNLFVRRKPSAAEMDNEV